MSRAGLDDFLADCERLAEHFKKRGPLAGGVFTCGTKPRICAIWYNGATVFVETKHAQRGDAHAVAEAWNALPDLLRIVRDLRDERDRALARLGEKALQAQSEDDAREDGAAGPEQPPGPPRPPR